MAVTERDETQGALGEKNEVQSLEILTDIQESIQPGSTGSQKCVKSNEARKGYWINVKYGI